MQNLEQKTLALFFTCGISLKTWEKVGNLGREIRPYKELAKQFKEIYFFTYGKLDLEFEKVLPNNIKVFPKCYKMPSWLYSLFLPLVYRKELAKADILKTNQMSGSWTAVLAKLFFKKRLVIRCGYEWLNVLEKEKKALWKRLLVRVLERLAYNSSDKIIFTSQKDKDFAKNKFKIPSEKIEIIPNYIDTDIFKPFSSTERKGIVYVGRLSKEKNLPNLVRAVGKLQVGLTLIGQGPQEEQLRKLASEAGANVEFKGKIANESLPQELNKASIFVLLSFYEGCPKALLEAMASGVACIGTDVEGIKEVIQHKENGYLCGIDADSIKKAIQEVLEDDVLQEKLALAARETILKKFSLEEILRKETALYEAL